MHGLIVFFCLTLPDDFGGAASVRGKVANVGKSMPTDEDPVHRAAAEALSDVDLASQEIILLSLAAHFPFVRLDAEEDTPLVERFAEEDKKR